MQVKPWFSHEVGKGFRKWENGGERFYHCMGKAVKILVHKNCMWGRYKLKFHKPDRKDIAPLMLDGYFRKNWVRSHDSYQLVLRIPNCSPQS